MPDYLLAADAPLALAVLADLLANGGSVALTAGAAAGFAPAGAPATDPELAMLRAHACGTGPEVPQPLVRLMLLLSAQQAINQPNGLALSTAERLLALYNRELLPVVFEQGGDGAARAHLALPLLGEGEVNYQGYRLAAADALSLFSWAPLALRTGEAAALRRGIPFTLAHAVDAVLRAQRLARAAAAVRALSALATGETAAPIASVAALDSAARAVEKAIQGPEAASLAPALGQLAGAVATLGQAAAVRTARVSAAPEAGPAAMALAAHGQVLSQLVAAEADPYAALRARQLVETAEQLLGLELLAAARALEAKPAGGPTGAAGALLAAFRAAVPATAGQAPYLALRQAAAFVRRHAWAPA